jgi:signal transduction histidine kinase
MTHASSVETAANDRPGGGLRTQILRRLLAMSLWPLALFGLGVVGYGLVQERRDARNRLTVDAATAAAVVANEFERHRDLVRLAVLRLQSPECGEIACIQRQLDRLQQGDRHALSSLYADAQGRVLAVSTDPARLTGPAGTPIGQSVADREYFQRAIASRDPVISNGFVGRGLGNDPLVAVSQRVLDRDGRVAGVVQVSLSLRQFDRLRDALDLLGGSGRSLWIVDRNDQLLWRSDDESAPAVRRLPGRLAEDLRPGDTAFAGADGLSHRGFVRELPPTPLRVVAHMPDRPFGQRQAVILVLLVGVGALSALVARWIAGRTARGLAGPLDALSRNLHALRPERPDTLQLAPLPADSVPELRQMQDDLQQLLRRLGEAMEAERLQQIENSVTRQKLADTVADQDRRIEAQTMRLRLALSNAEEAAQAKTRLLANTSHEIRTPLNGIIGTAELMLREPLPEPQRRQVEIILDCARSQLALVSDILDLSRLTTFGDESALEPFDLAAALRQCADMLRPIAAQKGLTLELALPGPSADWRNGRPQRIKQIVQSLVSNAIKFTDQGGVRLELERLQEPRLRIVVSDSGLGIPEHALEQIFEPFYQVDSAASRLRGGTGLGLTIARELVQAMGGSIHAECGEPRGSRFVIELDLPVVAPPQPRKGGAAPEDFDLDGLVVLAVDDIELNRSLLKAQLQVFGITAGTADGGESALKALADPAINLVLMDCQMPGMDGYQAARAIRERWPDRRLRIVAVTAHTQEGERDRCIAAGMDDYLAKPVMLDALLQALRASGAALAGS